MGTLWKFEDKQYRKSEEIEAAVGYWIFLAGDLLKVFSIHRAGSEGNSLKTVKSGWNLLGLYSPVPIPAQKLS